MRREESEFLTKFFSEEGTKAVNNDYFGYVCLDNYAIWVIADGYGDEIDTEIISKTAVESVVEHFMLEPEFSSDKIKEMLNYANFKVQEKQFELKNEVLQTSVSILISNYHSYLYGGVGNCRFYHMRDGYIIARSNDDTLAQSLVDEAMLEAGSVKDHRHKNNLLQAVGDKNKLNINVIKRAVELKENDNIILATLGFWENVSDEEIEIEVDKIENREELIQKLKDKISSVEKSEIENNTFVIIDVKKLAVPELLPKMSKQKVKRLIVSAIIIIALFLGMNIYVWANNNRSLKNIRKYNENINKEIENKNFNNVKENIKLKEAEYKKIEKLNKGIIGKVTISKPTLEELEKMKRESEEEEKEVDKLEKTFRNIFSSNALFDEGKYEEALGNYINAKYVLGETNYKRDELKLDEIILVLDQRIREIGKLKEAKNLEKVAEVAIESKNYKLALEKYKEVKNIYDEIAYVDYAEKVETKMIEITEMEKGEYNKAILTENQGNIYEVSNVETAKEKYREAMKIYEVLGDKEKVNEIKLKIEELDNKRMINMKDAKNKVENAMSQIKMNNTEGGIEELIKAKEIYYSIGDEIGAENIERFIGKLRDFVQLEERNKVELDKEKEKNKIILELKENEIKKEKEKLEIISQKMKEITMLEMEAEDLYSLKRYMEAIRIYKNIKGKYIELNNELGNEAEQNKEKQIDDKIMKIEILLYEKEGDEEGKNKNYKEAEQKYKNAIDKMNNIELDVNIKDRINKKYEKIIQKNNKRWWEFWK